MRSYDCLLPVVVPWLNFTPDLQQVQAERFSLLTSHSTFKWATLFVTLVLQRLVFPKVPLSAQRFNGWCSPRFPSQPNAFHSFIHSVTSSTSCPTNCFADTCTITAWPAIDHRSTKNPIRRHSSSHPGKRSQAQYPSREDRLHAVSPPTPRP